MDKGMGTGEWLLIRSVRCLAGRAFAPLAQGGENLETRRIQDLLVVDAFFRFAVFATFDTRRGLHRPVEELHQDRPAGRVLTKGFLDLHHAVHG